MRVRPALTALLVAGLLMLPACDATGDDPAEIVTDPPFGEPPGEGDAVTVPPDAPMPVETDGGIGGEPDGPVTSSLIVASDDAGADQVEVSGTCLVADDPPTYRLDLAGGGTLTVATGDEGGSLALEHEGRIFTSPDGEPPALSTSPGALSAQGRTVAEDGTARFVDAVIALDDVPDC